MIELRGLHLGNIARSPAESVRPDLWPDHAWVPVLGCTGGVLYDLCGGMDGTIYGCSWGPGYLDWVSTGDMVVTGARTGEGSLSVHLDIDVRSNGISETMYSRMYDASATVQTNGARFNVETFSSGVFTAGPYISNKQIAVADLAGSSMGAVYNRRIVGVTDASMYSGGKERAVVSGSAATYVDGAIVIGNRITADRTADMRLRAMLVYRRPLPSASMATLHADPLLPFRRRQPTYYSVPSGGNTETPAAMMMAL